MNLSETLVPDGYVVFRQKGSESPEAFSGRYVFFGNAKNVANDFASLINFAESEYHFWVEPVFDELED